MIPVSPLTQKCTVVVPSSVLGPGVVLTMPSKQPWMRGFACATRSFAVSSR